MARLSIGGKLAGRMAQRHLHKPLLCPLRLRLSGRGCLSARESSDLNSRYHVTIFARLWRQPPPSLAALASVYCSAQAGSVRGRGGRVRMANEGELPNADSRAVSVETRSGRRAGSGGWRADGGLPGGLRLACAAGRPERERTVRWGCHQWRWRTCAVVFTYPVRVIARFWRSDGPSYLTAWPRLARSAVGEGRATVPPVPVGRWAGSRQVAAYGEGRPPQQDRPMGAP
jgi:hypothetical protein